MKASQARDISRNSLCGPLIAPYLEAVYAKIRKAAALGKNSIVHPFHEVSPYPATEVQAAVLRHLAAEDGYIVRHHPNPDPGHPCSGPYDEISW